MKITFVKICLIVLTLVNLGNATTPYVVTIGANEHYEIFSANTETGNFTKLASIEPPNDEQFFPNFSCMDPKTQTLYFAGSNYLYAVNVLKKTHKRFAWHMSSVSAMIWDPLVSKILMVVSFWDDSSNYFLIHYPPAGGIVTMLVNLTALNIFEYDNVVHYNAFDADKRIFYTVAHGEKPMPSNFFNVQQFNLNDTRNVVTTNYTCAHIINYMAFDSVRNILVGVAGNFTLAHNFQLENVFTVTLDNGRCTPSPVCVVNTTKNELAVPSAAYDSATSTFYVGYQLSNGEDSWSGLKILNTQTLKITDFAHAYGVYDIALGY